MIETYLSKTGEVYKSSDIGSQRILKQINKRKFWLRDMITKLQNIEDFGGRGSNYREKTYNSERHGRHMAHILTANVEARR